MPKGIILKGVGGTYTVFCNGDNYDCKPRGLFRKLGVTPLPGDDVLFDTGKENEGYITEILPRDNVLIRPAVANVDIMVIVVALSSPEPDFLLVDKISTACFIQSIEPVICANKSDGTKDEYMTKIINNYRPTGIKTFFTSALNNTGIDEMVAYFTQKTVVFAGQSGTGKSTLINTIIGKEVMETGKISVKIERGKHTTRHTNFILTKDGAFIADTPGFSNIEPHDIDEKELQYYYPEFDRYMGRCKYQGCIHINEPDCKIKQAVEDGLIGAGRYENYIRIYNRLIENNKQKRGY